MSYKKSKRIKMPPARRTIPDLTKLKVGKRHEWFGTRPSFNAVYNKAKRHGVSIRSVIDGDRDDLIHYWRVA